MIALDCNHDELMITLLRVGMSVGVSGFTPVCPSDFTSAAPS